MRKVAEAIIKRYQLNITSTVILWRPCFKYTLDSIYQLCVHGDGTEQYFPLCWPLDDLFQSWTVSTED